MDVAYNGERNEWQMGEVRGEEKVAGFLIVGKDLVSEKG